MLETVKFIAIELYSSFLLDFHSSVKHFRIYV